MCHKLAQSTSLPASIESGVLIKNSLVPNSATLYKIKLSKCYGVLPIVYHQLPMITMVTAALPLHLFSVVSHSSLHLSYLGHTVQTLQTPFMPTQVPISLSSRCNKLLPFSGSYIYLIFFVQLRSPKSPITAGSGSTPPK